MIKTVGIVSLSSGVLGEGFVSHEVRLGQNRLESLGLRVKFLPHARMGMAYVKEHPEKRAEDLLAAFYDDEIDLILCAIGGDDTYRLAPYLFKNDALKKAVAEKAKPFLGFSDTTLNHLMLHKCGLPSFYGQAFLPDVCEMEDDMLPYTKQYFEEFLKTGTIQEIRPSRLWYESRTDFSESQLGTKLRRHENGGFERLQGAAQFSGEILGGCIDSLFDIFDPARYEDMPDVCRQYGLFPDAQDWQGKILLLESSEEQMAPAKYKKALEYLKNAGVFDAVSGVLVGKPMDEKYAAEYKKALVTVVNDPALPIVCNVNIGHALPRCIMPFGKLAHVDAQAQCIRFEA